MKFRTELIAKPSENKLNHSDFVFFLGSCFSQHLGTFLQESGFKTIINPAGTLFHPMAIFNILEHLIDEKIYQNTDLITYQSNVYSLFHAKQSDTNSEILLNNLNSQREQHSIALKQSNWLFLTFGTSFAYFYKENAQCVANCHKIPNHLFEKKFIECDEMITFATPIIEKIYQNNPKIKIVLTISPVKHIKDGIVDNSFSKANLQSFVRKLCTKFNEISYFPSYELMTEDLRDYRFYEADLIHPNPMAIHYIIEFFKQMYFTTETQHITKLFNQLKIALSHQIQNQNHELNSFKNHGLKLIHDLEKAGFELTKEKEYFENL